MLKINNQQHLNQFMRHINPLFVWIIIVYVITRTLELAAGSQFFWEKIWNNIVNLFDVSDDVFVGFVTPMFIISVYWIVGGVFLFLDLTKKPEFLRKYKIQKDEPVNVPKLLKTIKRVLVNQFLIGLPMMNISYQAAKRWTVRIPLRSVPTFQSLMFDLFICSCIHEVLFYYMHRMMHSKFFYKRIHKTHHEWTSTISISAIYCHPLEQLFNNLLPSSAGLIFTKSEISTVWIWLSIRAISTLLDHSGYHFPYINCPLFHDYHHEKFNQNFGMNGILDFIHGTNSAYRKTIQYSRQKVLLSIAYDEQNVAQNIAQNASTTKES